MDRGSYDTRGFYERMGWQEPGQRPPERFTEQTWIARDICERHPYPFDDRQIDFVICAHTLEDVRDPVWVCSEMSRVGKAGYIETPSRLEEQSWGVEGPFVGHSHHHWMVNLEESRIEFVFKQHGIESRPKNYFPAGFWTSLDEEERVARLWWEDTFSYGERFFSETDGWGFNYPAEFVSRELAARNLPARPHSAWHRLLSRLQPRVRR